MEIQITGEYMVPGKFPIKTEQEHYERYIFSAKLVRNKKVLDIACGVGYGCKMLSEAGAQGVVGIDILDGNIQFAQNNYYAENISFFQNNIYDINYVEEFDIITSFETIEHIENANLALRKLYQALKQNGILIISTPNRSITSPGAKTINDKPLNEHHQREYILSEFKDLVIKNGFIIKAIFGQRNRLFLPINIFNRVINKFLKPDIKGNAELKKNFLTVARYYTLVLGKDKF